MADIFNFTDTWTVGGTTYNAIKVDVTDTASAAASLLLNLSVGGAVKFSVKKDGHILGLSAALGGATIGTDALAVTGTAALSGGTLGAGIVTLLTQGTASATTGDNSTVATFRNNITSVGALAAYSVKITRQNSNTAAWYLGNDGDTNSVLATNNGQLRIGHDVSGTFYNDLAIRGSGITTGAILISAPHLAAYGWTSTSDPSGGTFDTNISRQAAGVVQFGTTAANASGAWLAAKGTLTGGTLADQAQVLSITATQPTSPSGSQWGVGVTITSAGSAAANNYGCNFVYGAGFTGAARTAGMLLSNSAAGTGAQLIPAAGSNFGNGNWGFNGNADSVTVGHNVGVVGRAETGLVSTGVVGLAQISKNSATNIGGVFSAINTGSSPVQIGAFACLNQTTVPTVSAALIADNGAQTDPIFLARDNGTTVLTVADGGTLLLVAAPATDATKTTATLCRDTTSGEVYVGSGVIGVCLGTSSARYKNRINNVTAGLAEVVQLQPKRFWYNPDAGDKGAKEQVGFLAEDVVKVLPNLVGLDAKGQPNTLDLVGMMPIVIKAIQELKAVDDDKDQLLAVAIQAIQEQQVRIEELEARKWVH